MALLTELVLTADRLSIKIALLTELQPREREEIVSKSRMPSPGLDRAQQNVAVAPGDHCEVGAGFELLAGSHPLGDDELAFD